MRRITLSDGAQIAEIVAATAVVISLLYVGLQLQANTAAIRSSSVQAITNSAAAVLQLQAANPALLRVRRLGDANPVALSEEDAYQYYIFYRYFWLFQQNTYFQRQLGVLDENVWGVYERIICDQASTPGVVATWPEHAKVLDPAFVSVFESC